MRARDIVRSWRGSRESCQGFLSGFPVHHRDERAWPEDLNVKVSSPASLDSPFPLEFGDHRHDVKQHKQFITAVDPKDSRPLQTSLHHVKDPRTVHEQLHATFHFLFRKPRFAIETNVTTNPRGNLVFR
jgi:hypothetical protein